VSALAIGISGIAALFVLILCSVPIAYAMIIVGVIGFAAQANLAPALTFLATEPVRVLGSIDMATTPMFLLMGAFANEAGFSEDIYSLAAALFGHRRGGLAYATIAGCAAFGSICGSTTATAATFGKIALPQMLKRGYAPSFAAGTVAAGGTLKSLIPPSLLMILYCIQAKTFIFDLFLAAAIPALMTVVFNMAAIAISLRAAPELAPTSPPVGLGERWAAFRRAIPALVLLIAVFGGLYSGIFTVNEAASVAVIMSLVFAILRRRLNPGQFLRALHSTAGSAIMLYMILIGASVFTYFIALAHIPEALLAFVDRLRLAPLGVIAMLLVAYIILGTIFEELSAILVTLPFVLPIVTSTGYDPVWWGVVCVIQAELALIHPPFGIIVFLLHRLEPDIPMPAIYRGVIPFLIADFAVLVLLTLFPELVLWLPKVLAP
jgi:tripartite ATP-independent transporter DctM subunit